ncbi:MAG TPA: PDZ domain-containing protein, partial [Gammaproteobacteria bacterium]|nr:PDZ domain-containing protein [Gammaproteobacteria bacterium]
TPALAQALGTDVKEGAVVTQVLADSPAAQAGLKVGDVIISVDGQKVSNGGELRNRIGLMAIGSKPKLGVHRDGQTVTVTPTIIQARQRSVDGASLDERLAGATFEPASGRPQEGMIGVTKVAQGSPAYQAGLRSGDRITSVNRQQVETLQQFGDMVRQGGDTILLGINRQGTPLLVAIQ